jgi:hypothetical protein
MIAVAAVIRLKVSGLRSTAQAEKVPTTYLQLIVPGSSRRKGKEWHEYFIPDQPGAHVTYACTKMHKKPIQKSIEAGNELIESNLFTKSLVGSYAKAQAARC